MLRIFTCFLLIGCLSVSGYSQSLDVTFDYEVTYEIPSLKRNTIDTLVVKMDKKGHYIFTESNSIGLDFATTVFKNRELDLSSATSALLLDTRQMVMYFNFEMDKNVMFFKMDLDNLIPNLGGAATEDLNVVSEKLSEKVSIGNSNYDAYLMYPESEPENPLTVVIDSNRPVDNFSIIEEFFKMMLRKSSSDGGLNVDIPAGLILSIESKDQTLIKAIRIKDVITKINIQHSFNIKE